MVSRMESISKGINRKEVRLALCPFVLIFLFQFPAFQKKAPFVDGELAGVNVYWLSKTEVDGGTGEKADIYQSSPYH